MVSVVSLGTISLVVPTSGHIDTCDGLCFDPVYCGPSTVDLGGAYLTTKSLYGKYTTTHSQDECLGSFVLSTQ